jgi:hypothetical protein
MRELERPRASALSPLLHVIIFLLDVTLPAACSYLVALHDAQVADGAAAREAGFHIYTVGAGLLSKYSLLRRSASSPHAGQTPLPLLQESYSVSPHSKPPKFSPQIGQGNQKYAPMKARNQRNGLNNFILRAIFSFIITLLTPILTFHKFVYMPIKATQRTRLVDKLKQLLAVVNKGSGEG